ncbi:hypothetical protein LIP_1143 [Limnochorda pilosa]|uniref:Uncharacterized protein n=1 Tax=Limnochorda pilosa TaxID=1555112 RepID=A0A0K2SIT3_LIMPI|nr:hypothetical protein LIP_1143 [Limnochorda pilosa]
MLAVRILDAPFSGKTLVRKERPPLQVRDGLEWEGRAVLWILGWQGRWWPSWRRAGRSGSQRWCRAVTRRSLWAPACW